MSIKHFLIGAIISISASNSLFASDAWTIENSLEIISYFSESGTYNLAASDDAFRKYVIRNVFDDDFFLAIINDFSPEEAYKAVREAKVVSADGTLRLTRMNIGNQAILDYSIEEAFFLIKSDAGIMPVPISGSGTISIDVEKISTVSSEFYIKASFADLNSETLEISGFASKKKDENSYSRTWGISDGRKLTHEEICTLLDSIDAEEIAKDVIEHIRIRTEAEMNELLEIENRIKETTEMNAESAEELLAASERFTPGSYQQMKALLQSADVYFALGQYEKAAEIYLKLTDSNCYLRQLAIMNAAACYENIGNLDTALTLYNLLLADGINQIHAPKALFNSGVIHYIEGDYDTALRVFSLLADNYLAPGNGAMPSEYARMAEAAKLMIRNKLSENSADFP